ncbi:MAG: 1-acyl-sn-glycerol-3-phosphate acyltransferase [Proteobacteria bacterium]|nr:1-acyl-sn-glycerol-3-phosphate acyltransferase [Pseudomonadota bacterium]
MIVIQTIRSLLFEIGRIFIIILVVPFGLLALPLHPVKRSRILGWCAHLVIPWLRFTCGISHRIDGLNNIPNRPCVLLVKHQSAWETFALQTIFPPQTWVLKKELLYIPVFGWGLWASRPIAIDRSTKLNALDQVVVQGIRVLAEGRWVVVFPEGTRVPYGQKKKYNAGGAKLAIEAGVPIIPVAHNAGRLWGKRSFLKSPGVINVAIGQPIMTDAENPRELTRQAENWIENKLKEWAKQAGSL